MLCIGLAIISIIAIVFLLYKSNQASNGINAYKRSEDYRADNQLLFNITNDSAQFTSEYVNTFLPGCTFYAHIDQQADDIYIDYYFGYNILDSNFSQDIKVWQRDSVQNILTNNEEKPDISEYLFHYSDFNHDGNLSMVPSKRYLVTAVFKETHKTEWSNIPNVDAAQICNHSTLSPLSQSATAWFAVMNKAEYEDDDVIMCYSLREAEGAINIRQQIEDKFILGRMSSYLMIDTEEYQNVYTSNPLTFADNEIRCFGLVLEGDSSSLKTFIRNAETLGLDIKLLKIVKEL